MGAHSKNGATTREGRLLKRKMDILERRQANYLIADTKPGPNGKKVVEW